MDPAAAARVPQPRPGPCHRPAGQIALPADGIGGPGRRRAGFEVDRSQATPGVALLLVSSRASKLYAHPDNPRASRLGEPSQALGLVAAIAQVSGRRHGRRRQVGPDPALCLAAPMAHKPCNVDGRRDDAEAVANDLAGNKKRIHGRHPPLRRILLALSSGRPLPPDRWRAALANNDQHKPSSVVKTAKRTGNRQARLIFLAPARG
jgi:hypothetical protein